MARRSSDETQNARLEGGKSLERAGVPRRRRRMILFNELDVETGKDATRDKQDAKHR